MMFLVILVLCLFILYHVIFTGVNVDRDLLPPFTCQILEESQVEPSPSVLPTTDDRKSLIPL